MSYRVGSIEMTVEHGDSGPKSSATVLLGRQLSEGRPDFAAATSEKIRSLLLAINALGDDHTLKSTAVGNWLGVGETWTTLDGATQTQIVRIIEGGPQSEESRTGLQQLSESSMARHAKEEMPLGEYRVMVSLFKQLGGEKQASGWAWGAYRRFVSGKRRDEMQMEAFLVVTAILGESGVRPQGNDMAHIRSLALGFLRNDGQTGRDFDRLLAASGLTDAGLDEAESKVLLDALARWGNRSHEISDATFADLAKLLGTKHGKVALQESLFDGQGRANLLVAKVLAWQARSQHRRPSDDYGEVRALLKRLNQSSVSRKQQGDELAQTELAKAYVVGMIGPKVYRQRGREQIERALLAAQSGEMKARCLEELMVIASSREIRDRVRQLMRELEPGLGTNQLADLRSRWSALAPGDGAVERASDWRKRFDAADRGLVRQVNESKLASGPF